MNWHTALGLLVAINFTLELINNAVDIRLKYDELQKLGVPETNVEAIIERRINDGLETLRQQIAKDTKLEEPQQSPTEIDKTLDTGLRLLLDKLQNGVVFDVIASPPEATDSKAPEKATIEAFSKIKQLNSEIRKIKPPTHPVIALPPREGEIAD